MLIKLPVYNLAVIGTTALLIAGCAGRDARPVAISQPQDTGMSCAQIQAEMAGNNQLISDLGSEKGAKVAQNIAAGVAGILIWPIWFAMDFKGAASTDQEALKQRNIYLASMATSERCSSASTVVAATPQPTSVEAPPTMATTQGPVSLTPAPVATFQPAAYTAPPLAATPVAVPAQTVTGAKPPPIYTFSHASDATSPEQSSDFDDMINSVANGNVPSSDRTH